MRPFLLCAALAGALSCAAPACAAIAPAADLYVSAAHPARNYGTAPRLVVSARPRARAFLRFEAGPGARYVLRLYALRDAAGGIALRHANEGSWREHAVTSATAPRTGPRVVRSGALRRGAWKEVDVTDLVIPGSARVSLALEAIGRGTAAVASREDRAHAPQLIVEQPPVAHQAVAAPQPPTRIAEPAVPVPAPPPPPRVAPSSALPCGTSAQPPAWRHVVWIVLENKGYDQIMAAPAAPYLNRMAALCGEAASFFAETHPSLPNYIAMTSGSTQGIADDLGPSSHPLAVPSIFGQLGGDWRALQESMPSNCALASAGPYAVRHNPAAYFTGVRGACATQDVPLGGTPDVSARFTFITPDLCSDMHDCSVATGDAWLAQWVPKILDGDEYRSGTTAVFITTDEDGGVSGQHIPTLVLAPSIRPGTLDATPYTHYSMLRTTEEMLGLSPIGAAETATSMRAGLNLSAAWRRARRPAAGPRPCGARSRRRARARRPSPTRRRCPA